MTDETYEYKNQKIINKEITSELKQSFLDYAMSVIVSRALPDVRDGLKPVHRRILYAMHELSNFYNKPYKKSARIVGEVLGKYHPHGDSAIYDSLVRMAQDFSLRYTLIDGQGNFGSIDGDRAAAMRYTEVRMEKITEELLTDIEKETVKFIPNFDNELTEPTVLPSKIPNLLINGSNGIAVGMATNMAPHNLDEVISAIIHRIDNKECTVLDLMEFIKGPDFPTGGIILGKSGFYEAYKTGHGGIKIRSKTRIIEKNNRQIIEITEIPYMVNKTKLIEDIVRLVKDKKIEGISNLHDRSDKEGLRIEIDLKKDVCAQVVLNQLFKHTQLQSSFSIMNIAIVNNRPKKLNLIELIDQFIFHRIDIVTKRTIYDLKIAKQRQHILEGLKIALNNIDEIISFLKRSKNTNEAKEGLIKDYNLTITQAIAILDMKLQKLTSQEIEKLNLEIKEIDEKITFYEKILNEEQTLMQIIKQELNEMRKYNDQRKTKISDEEIDMEDEDLIPNEKIVILISKNNYIKQVSVDEYQNQKRGGTGIIGAQIKETDEVDDIISCNSHDHILFFTKKGRVHWLKAYKIPKASRYSFGIPIINLIELQKDDEISNWIKIDDFSKSEFIILITKKGIIKRSHMSCYSRPRRGGIIAITLKQNDELKEALKTNGNENILLASKFGKAIRFDEKQLRQISRTSQGVRGIRLKQNDYLVSATVERENKKLLLTITENGYGKITSIEEYRLQKRGGSGVINIKTDSRNGRVVESLAVNKMDEVLIISSSGKVIRISVSGINEISRNTKGVRLMRLKPNEKIIGMSYVTKQ